MSLCKISVNERRKERGFENRDRVRCRRTKESDICELRYVGKTIASWNQARQVTRRLAGCVVSMLEA
jgi:hypothetical protein